MTTKPRPNRAQQQTLRAFLKQYSQSASGLLKLSISLGTLNALLMIASCYLLANAVHQVMFEQANLQAVSPLLWPLAGLILVRALLVALSERVSNLAALKIKNVMRNTLLEKLTKLGPAYSEQKGHGATLNTLHNGVEALHQYYANYIPSVAYSALIPFAILVVIFPTDYKAGLIFLLTAPLIPFFMILVGHKAEQLNQERWQQLAVLGNYFFDRLQGLTQLKLFNATKRELNSISQISDDYRGATMGVLKVAFLSSFALEFLATISVALVAVIIGFRLFFGTLDFATGFVVLLLAPEFYLPLKDIKLTALSYHYPETNEGVTDINLTLPNTGLIAFVGESGSGKSTLFDCLLGFHHHANHAISINGQPLSDTALSDWHAQLAWIPQHATLFYRSVADNLRLAKPDACQDELIEAASKAGALEFINALPHGFDTLLGEQGEGLSGGQKQRIALARAFLKDAPVLLLDEPTAHLDSQTEQLINQAICEYAKNHLVLVIAHRLNTVKHADTLYVMQQGSIVESGRYKQLVNDAGLFAKLVSRGEAHA